MARTTRSPCPWTSRTPGRGRATRWCSSTSTSGTGPRPARCVSSRASGASRWSPARRRRCASRSARPSCATGTRRSATGCSTPRRSTSGPAATRPPGCRRRSRSLPPRRTARIRRARRGLLTAMTQDAPSALRALFAGYADMFDRLAAQDLRFWTRRALTRRFLTGHVRTTVTELECTLHRQAAVDGDSTLRRPLLDDLEHFRAALDPAFSTFARTLIGLAIVLVAQLLGRLPLVPIVSGPARKPALGSLNDAVAVDPGHVAKAIADLLGSPPSTICGALATVAAAGFLVLGPCIPALRAQRRLLRDSVDGLEADAFTALGGSPPHRRRLDLLIWWCLPVFAVSLGLAWYAAYLHGLMRATPGNAGRHNAVDVVIRTDRPLLLGLG